MEFSSGIISLSGFVKCLASTKGSPKFYQVMVKTWIFAFYLLQKRHITVVIHDAKISLHRKLACLQEFNLLRKKSADIIKVGEMNPDTRMAFKSGYNAQCPKDIVN